MEIFALLLLINARLIFFGEALRSVVFRLFVLNLKTSFFLNGYPENAADV
jgi:hypothetical protein